MDFARVERTELAPPAVSAATLRAAATRVGTVLVFGVLPAALVAWFVLSTIDNNFAFDFHQFWQGARDVLDGRSPYPDPEALPSSAAAAALDPEGIQEVFRFPYPAAAAIALLPLGALPFGVAAALLTAALLASVALTLRLLDVRDWRCYGVAFLSITTLGAVRLGTLTPLLLLGVAAAWRYRDRPRAVVPIVAVLVAVKLFLWPLLVWLAVTRRAGSAVAAAVLSAGALVLSWAAIGFAGFADYPELVRRLADAVEAKSYSVTSLVLAFGATDALAQIAALALGTAVLAVAALAGRRARSDEAALAAVLAAALVLSPIVWLHYFALLLVPVALRSQRLNWTWLLLLAFWVTPFQESGGDRWRILFAGGVALVVCVAPSRPLSRLGRAAGGAWRARAIPTTHGGPS